MSFQWLTSGDESAMYVSWPADWSKCDIMSKTDFHRNAHDNDASASSEHSRSIINITSISAAAAYCKIQREILFTWNRRNDNVIINSQELDNFLF